MPQLGSSRIALASTAVLLATGLLSCGSKGPTGASGSITLSLSGTVGRAPVGGATVVVATVTRIGGFTGTVNFAITGAPAGVTATVSEAQTFLAVTTATVTLKVDNSTVLGSYPVVVHAIGAGIPEATVRFTLTVDPLPGVYGIILNNPQIVQGGSGVASVELVRANFTGLVTLSVDNIPAGITAVVAKNPVADTSSIVITVASSVTPGTHDMTVRGTSTLDDQIKILTIIVTAAVPVGNFTLTTTPTPSITLVQGNHATVSVNVVRTGGFTGLVALVGFEIPPGLNVSFAPNPAGGDAATLTLTAGAGLAVGGYPIVIHGTVPGLAEQTVTLLVNVIAP